MKRRWKGVLAACIVMVLLITGLLMVSSCGKPEEKEKEKPEKETGTIAEETEELQVEIVEEELPEVNTEEENTEEENIEEENIEEELPEEKVVRDTGITICIDPGHYEGANQKIFDDGSSYCEGDTTLLIAVKLQEILENEYGIHSYLTRDSGTITMEGYSNRELDKGHISLRGEAARDSALFVSIHTNANNEQANGCETWYQPVEINKPLIIANEPACADQNILNMCNCIGKNLVRVLVENNISAVGEFHERTENEDIPEWTDTYNDSLNTAGTIVKRTGNSGDYYGVLRGSANVNVPGIIIEHLFHTVPHVRNLISNGTLVEEIARADAKGIAEGFGIIE